jgi:hypothetical protein
LNSSWSYFLSAGKSDANFARSDANFARSDANAADSASETEQNSGVGVETPKVGV